MFWSYWCGWFLPFMALFVGQWWCFQNKFKKKNKDEPIVFSSFPILKAGEFLDFLLVESINCLVDRIESATQKKKLTTLLYQCFIFYTFDKRSLHKKHFFKSKSTILDWEPLPQSVLLIDWEKKKGRKIKVSLPVNGSRW